MNLPLVEEVIKRYEIALAKWEALPTSPTREFYIAEMRVLLAALTLYQQKAWVSVDERLPETDERVIFFEGNEVTVGTYQASGCEEACWWDSIFTDMSGSASYVDASQVTHWQPLPAPPVVPSGHLAEPVGETTAI